LTKINANTSHTDKLNSLKKIIQCSDPINIQYTSVTLNNSYDNNLSIFQSERFLLNTQGTTGSPKGVVLSHHMVLNNAYFGTLAQDYHINRTITCMPVPLYHCKLFNFKYIVL
jgi:acyl-CoA synthetase (AMP-forming)/AMP-acid ligase II